MTPEEVEDTAERLAIGQALRAARESLGWSQYDVAAELDTSQSFVSNIENATRGNVQLRSLQRYARAVGKRLRIEVE